MPGELSCATLSDPRLQTVWRTAGNLEFATVGSGNHFVELQADETERLWLMVHSGSRAIGHDEYSLPPQPPTALPACLPLTASVF